MSHDLRQVGPIIDKIKEAFPVYNRKEFDDHWEDDKLQGYFNEWLDEFITLSTDVPNYDDRTYLTKVMAHFHPMKRLHPGSWGWVRHLSWVLQNRAKGLREPRK